MNPIYVVLISSLIVWGGLYVYLLTVESRIRKLELEIEFLDRQSHPGEPGEESEAH